VHCKCVVAWSWRQRLLSAFSAGQCLGHVLWHACTTAPHSSADPSHPASSCQLCHLPPPARGRHRTSAARRCDTSQLCAVRARNLHAHARAAFLFRFRRRLSPSEERENSHENLLDVSKDISRFVSCDNSEEALQCVVVVASYHPFNNSKLSLSFCRAVQACSSFPFPPPPLLPPPLHQRRVSRCLCARSLPAHCVQCTLCGCATACCLCAGHISLVFIHWIQPPTPTTPLQDPIT